MTSPINGNTGNFPYNLQLSGNRLYMNAVNFNAFSYTSANHALISVDTAGLNPVCLEYKYAGATAAVANGGTSLIISPTDIYLIQNPNSIPWDGDFSAGNAAMTDIVVTKVKTMTASGLTPVFTRKLTNQGDQVWQKMEYVRGKIVGMTGVQNDPTNQQGVVDIFKIEADTGFTIGPNSCAANVTPAQFANPTVSVNSSYAFATISNITWAANTTTLSSSPVTLVTNNPCNPPDTIINKYAAITGLLPCSNTFSVDTASGFASGDTVLMIQMKGASIDSSNNSSFGNILLYNEAGNYEYNVVQTVAGNNITLMYQLQKNYNIPNGLVQLVKIPSFSSYTVAQKNTCLPWTGAKGGVFVLRVAGTLTLNANIDVSGRGFKGGMGNTGVSGNLLCNVTTFYHSPTTDTSAQKGEGIAIVSVLKSYGRGKLANGGGGGNAHNAGGGGGSNAGAGGLGGNQFSGCTGVPPTNIVGGVGGGGNTYSTTSTNKVFLGGGGGAGHANDHNNVLSDGGNGGGLVIINAGSVAGNGYSIIANGANAPECSAAASGCANDGMGGGGGGGTVLLTANNLTNANLFSMGGKGANVYGFAPFASSFFGPGGGGGGEPF